MATAAGTGAEVQKLLATVAIGALISALIVSPALYSRFDERDRGRKKEKGSPSTRKPQSRRR
jgi:Cu/Ag efflux pump CusA